MSEMKHKLFSAQWCGNCKVTKQNLTEMGIEFEYIDIDTNHDLAVEHNIRSLPTLITVDGQRAVGLVKIMDLVKGG